METTKNTTQNGIVTQRNWMLDEVIDLFEDYNVNDDSNDDLIRQLTIQKIEYGRTCIAQFLVQAEQARQTMNAYWEIIDNELQNKILELGGKPRIITF